MELGGAITIASAVLSVGVPALIVVVRGLDRAHRTEAQLAELRVAHATKIERLELSAARAGARLQLLEELLDVSGGSRRLTPRPISLPVPRGDRGGVVVLERDDE